MATVAESPGTVNFDQALTDTRAIWREAVTTVAERAKATLPACNGRVDKAVALVLNGDVDMLGDGTARVASQSNGQTVYHIVNGHCDCNSILKFFQVDNAGMLRMTSSARYFKEGVGSRRPN